MRKIVLLALSALFITALSACETSVEGDTYLLSNPYGDVEWDSVNHMLASLHSHTTHSDGAATPDALVDLYEQQEYGALAITDHDYMIDDDAPIAYPWDAFSSINPEWEDRDSDAVGLIDIPGVEYSKAHHFVGLWTDVLKDYHPNHFDSDHEYLMTLMEDIMEADEDALMFMAHPGRYTDDQYPVPEEGEYSLEWYMSLYDTYDALIGVEVFCGRNTHSLDRHLWEQLLVEYLPERPIWALANDDFHGDDLNGFGRSKNIFLMDDETDEDEFYRNLTEGRFYVEYTRQDLGYAPKIDAVTVDEAERTIEVEVEGDYDRIRWYGGYDYDGGSPELIKVGERFQYNDYEGDYIRAEVVYDEGGFEHAETVLQPFTFTRDSDRQE